MPDISDPTNLQSVQESVTSLQTGLAGLKGLFESAATGASAFSEAMTAGAQALKNLAASLSQVQTSDLQTLAKNIKAAATALKAMGETEDVSERVTALATALNKFKVSPDQADAVKVVAAALAKLGTAFKSMEGMSDQVSGLVNALQQIGASLAAFKVTPKKADSLKNIATSLGKLGTAFQSMSGMGDNVSSLSQALQHTGDAVSKFKVTPKKIEALKEVAASLARLGTAFKTMGDVQDVSGSVTSLGEALNKLQDVAGRVAVFGKTIQQISEAVNKFRVTPTKAESLKTVAISLSKVGSAFKAMGDVSERITALVDALGQISSAVNSFKVTPRKMESLKTVATSLSKVGTAFKAMKGLSERITAFGNSLQRIGEIVNGFKVTSEKAESLKNVAISLNKVGTSFKSMDDVSDRVAAFATALQQIDAAVSKFNVSPEQTKSLKTVAISLSKLGTAFKAMGDVSDRVTALVNSLHRIDHAVNRFNVSPEKAQSLKTVATSLSKFGTAFKAMGDVSDRVTALANALNQIDHAVNSFKVTPEKAEALKHIATSLSKLGTAFKSMEGVSENVAALGNALQRIDDALSRIKVSSEKAEALKNVATSLSRLSAAFKGMGDVQGVSGRMAALGEALQTISNAINKMKVNPKKTEALASFLGALVNLSRSKSLDKLPDKLAALATAINNFNQSTKGSLDRATTNIREFGKSVSVLNTAAGSAMGGAVGSGGGGRSGLGITHRGLGELTAAISPLTIAFVTLTRVFRNFVNLFDVFSEFEFTMARVGGVTRTVGHEFQRLTDFAREMGATTIFTATDAAQAMETMGRLGFTAGEILSALPGVLNVAAGEGLKLADASRIIAVNLNAFELQASDTGRVSNVLAAASIRSAASMKDLGIGLRTVATFAHTAGIQLEETVTMLSRLADAGLTPFRASVALRQLLLQMQVPARAGAIEQLDKMNLSVSDINPKVVGLTNAINTLKSRMIEFGIDANRVFTIRASQAFQVLAQSGASALSSFEQSITGTNTAARLAERQMDTLHGSFRKLVSVWQEMQIGIGTALLPLVRGLTDSLAGLVRMFANLDDGQQRFIANTASMIAGLILFTQAWRVFGKIIGFVGRRWIGFVTSIVVSSKVMNASAAASITPWRLMGKLLPALKAKAVAFGVAATAALGPWGVAIAGAVTAISFAIGGLIHLRKRAEQQREQEATRERERLINELNLRGLILQRLNEQAEYQHARTFSAEEQEQLKALVDTVDGLNVEFDEFGRLVGSSAQEVQNLVEEMRRIEAPMKILDKIEKFRSRQGKVIFDLEERVALRAFAQEIGATALQFNNLGEAIFESRKQQEEFLKVMTEFRRQGEITLTGTDISEFEEQRATLLRSLSSRFAQLDREKLPDLFPEMDTASLGSYKERRAAIERELSDLLSADELSTAGSNRIETLLAQLAVERRNRFLTIINQIIDVTKQIDDAEQKRDQLESQKGVVNLFEPPPDVQTDIKGYLEQLDEIAKSTEKARLEADLLATTKPLQGQQQLLSVIENEIKQLEALRDHPSITDERSAQLEVDILKARLEMNKMIQQSDQRSAQKRLRQFEVELQTLTQGSEKWSKARIEANKYMLSQMAQQASEFDEIRPGTYNKWRKAVLDLTAARAKKLEEVGKKASDTYKEEISEVAKLIGDADYAGLLEAKQGLLTLEVEILDSGAFDYAEDLRIELENQITQGLKNADRRLGSMFKEGLLGQINLESAGLEDITDLQLLGDRMSRVQAIQRDVMEDDLYKPFEELQKEIPEATAAAIRSILDRMATLATTQMTASLEAGMDMQGILDKYENVIALLGDSFDMSAIIKLASEKSREREAQLKASFISATEALDDSLAGLTEKELEQKKIVFYQFAKIARSFGVSVQEFMQTYSEIIENIDNELNRRTDQAKSDAAYQKLRDQDLTIAPAAQGITPAGQESLVPTAPQAGTTDAQPQRTTIGQEMRQYRAPIFGYRDRSDQRIEGLRDQLESVRREEELYREQLQRGGTRRGDISRDPRILGFKKMERAIEDQIDAITRQTEAYTEFRQTVGNVSNIMFDSFSSLSTFIKGEGGKLLLSGLNIANQFDLAPLIEKLGASFGTLTNFFNTFGTSMQQAGSIVDFTGKLYSKNANAFTKHLAGIGSALSGIPGALQQGLGAGGALSSAAGGIAGFALGGPTGAALGGSIASALYAAISGKGDLQEAADSSSNVSGARGSVNVRNQNVTIGNINNEVTATIEGYDDIEDLADNLGGLFENNIATAGGDI